MNLTDPLIPIALVFLVLQSPLVVFAGWLAPKMGARRWLWVVLTAIPWIGSLSGYALILRAFSAVLDTLKKRNELLSNLHLDRRLGMSSITIQEA